MIQSCAVLSRNWLFRKSVMNTPAVLMTSKKAGRLGRGQKIVHDRTFEQLINPRTHSPREGLNNPHLGRNAIGCGSKIRFEDLSER